MSWINFANFVGVAALAVLCAVQWSRNGKLNALVIDLEKTREEQVRKIADDAGTIKNINADLDDFRNRLQLSEDEEKKDEEKIEKLTGQLRTAIAERDVATAERDQAKAALTEWEQAVKQRDEVIKKASGEIEKLGKDREEAVAKFNDLATKYNGLVKDLNEARAKLAQSR